MVAKGGRGGRGRSSGRARSSPQTFSSSSSSGSRSVASSSQGSYHGTHFTYIGGSTYSGSSGTCSSGENGLSPGLIFIFTIASIFGMILLIYCIYVCYSSTKHNKESVYPVIHPDVQPDGSLAFKTSHLAGRMRECPGRTLEFIEPCAIQSCLLIPNSFYFEIQLTEVPSDANIIVGLSSACNSADPYQVFGPGSISNDVTKSQVRLGNDPYVYETDSTCGKNDILGCCLSDFPGRNVTFSRNGIPDTPIQFPGTNTDLRVSLYATPGCKLIYNFGEARFLFDPSQSLITKPLDVSLPVYS